MPKPIWSRKRSLKPSHWHERTGRTRVLIEDPDLAQGWAAANILGRAGYDVLNCPGPEWHIKTTCPLVTEGHCELVDGADIVLCALDLKNAQSNEIFENLRSNSANKPVVVPVAETPGVDMSGCQVFRRPLTTQRLTAALDEAAAGRESIKR
ncbi:MAG TPA: hypothetical protein VMU77_04370 [Acidimicrobiales bacterium]|nr:hypothetical protein [Acidimicrobiales bacterium]